MAENLTLMTLCYVLVGLGLGATLAVPIATIQRWFVRWRGTMLGIVVAGPGIGGLIFPQLATYLITIYSWQTAYLTIAIIFGGVVAISSSFLASEPNAKKLRPFGDEKQHPEQGSHLQSVRSSVFISTQTFKSGAFWGMTAIGVLTFMPALFISAHLVPYAIDQGISAAVGARALGIIGVMTVIGRLVMTGVGGRIGWTKSLVICCATTSISVIGLIFVAAPWELFLFVVIYGFFWGSVVGLLSGAVGSFFGMATLSEVMGFLLGLSVLLGAAAPLLAGLSFDLTGSYFSAVVLSAISFAGAAIYSSLLKSPAR